MKKLIILSLSIAAIAWALMTGGCKKNAANPDTWVWKGTTYSSAATTAGTGASNGTLNVVSSSPAGSLQVYFYNGLPTTSGMDTVVAWGTAATESQVSISLGAGTNTYQSTGGNGSNQFVMVTVSGGKVAVATMAGSPVELLNVASLSTDSSGVTFSITQ
jgi:major membrane immunogen (membrane-anchored lipoprotein)